MAFKDYYRPLEEVLTGRDEKDRFPTREDLKPGKIYIDWESFSNVQSLLNKYRYCLVEGAERRGKTTLVRFVGFQYLANRQVFRVDIGQVEDINDLTEFIRLLEDGSLDRSDTLIIVEDCHMKPQVTERLLKTVEECMKASFLFTMRTVKQGETIPIEDPFEDSVIRGNDWVVRLDTSKEIIYNNIKGIVDKFVENNKSDLMRKSKPAPIHEDYQHMVEQTNGNKRILNYYLETWCHAEDPSLPLLKTDRKLVLEQFYKERLKGLSTAQLEVLKSMSVLGQFEIPIFVQPLFHDNFFDAAQEFSGLKEKGLAFRLSRQDEWLLADTESKFTLECLGASDYFICSILKTYVIESPNYFEVFHTLHRGQQRDLLISLVEDTEVFNSLIRHLSNDKTFLFEMLCILRAVGWADKDKGLGLWHEFKKAIGDKFLDEVQRKLVEAKNIKLTGMLLHFLKTIDREGQAIPMANAIKVEFFISQIRAEMVEFDSVNSMVQELHTLTPEGTKQVLNNLSKSDYKKFGERARKSSLQNIMWFLRLLIVHSLSETNAEVFLEGLGVEFLLEKIKASDFKIIGGILGILTKLEAVAPEKVKQVFEDLDKLNYVRLGEEARKSSLQQINWFLRLLIADEKLKKFADQYLNAIGQDTFTNMASTSSIGIIRVSRKLLNRLNTDIAKEVKNSLKLSISDEELIKRWADETVGVQSRKLWAWARTFKPQNRERGKRLVKLLADPNTALHFGEAEEAVPVANLSHLLFCAYYLDEKSAQNLALKAVNTLNVETMRYSLEHIVHLLKNCRWCNPDVAKQLVEKIFSSDASSLLLKAKGELNSFCQLLWESVISNEPRTKRWVTEVKETFWENLVVDASHSDTFHLLLVLRQVDEEIGKKVTHAVGQRLLTSLNLGDDPQALPLLGFFAFYGLNPQITFSFSLVEKVTELCIYPTSQRLAFSLLYLQELKSEVILGFIKAILALKDMTPKMALLLAEHPLPWTALTLADILVSTKSESRLEREDVYDRALLLFRTISVQRKIIYLGTLLNEMCTPQFAQRREPTAESEDDIEQEERKTRSWATIRLANAIDKEIFTIQKIENPITHKASRRLDLNWGNSQVAFTLGVIGDLLLALYKAQRDKGWVNIDTWDIAFNSRWIGEPLSQQQLRYWRKILLKMDMVKVDYQKTDESRWGITFRVNDEHPLVKSFITV